MQLHSLNEWNSQIGEVVSTIPSTSSYVLWVWGLININNPAIGFNVETVQVCCSGEYVFCCMITLFSTKTSNSKCGTWGGSLAYGTCSSNSISIFLTGG